MSYYQPPNQQQPQQPQYPQYQLNPQKPPKVKKEGFLRRNGGLLGVGASLATILTLFLTLGQQNSSTPPANTSTSQASSSSQVSAGYPSGVQQTYMNNCEAVNGSASASGCQCLLTWFENNISLQEFDTDIAQQADTGTVPEDATRANEACGF